MPDSERFKMNITDDTFQQKTEMLTRAAELFHRYGTPSHRLEGVMKRVSKSIDVDADYLYTPTSLFVSFEGDSLGARLMRIDAGSFELGSWPILMKRWSDLSAKRSPYRNRRLNWKP